MKRGEVRWYKFKHPDKKRPVVILTRNSILEYLGEVTIAPVTSTIRLRGGGLETQNRNDKQGLGLSRRNKHRFAAQEMLVLLAQLAHNLIIWTRNDLANTNPCSRKYGTLRTTSGMYFISLALSR